MKKKVETLGSVALRIVGLHFIDTLEIRHLKFF